MNVTSRAILLVSTGSMMLVAMAIVIKQLGTRLPATEILFFRSAIGFLFVLPFFAKNPLEPLRTKRQGAHLIRGTLGTLLRTTLQQALDLSTSFPGADEARKTLAALGR